MIRHPKGKADAKEDKSLIINKILNCDDKIFHYIQ